MDRIERAVRIVPRIIGERNLHFELNNQRACSYFIFFFQVLALSYLRNLKSWGRASDGLGGDRIRTDDLSNFLLYDIFTMDDRIPPGSEGRSKAYWFTSLLTYLSATHTL